MSNVQRPSSGNVRFGIVMAMLVFIAVNQPTISPATCPAFVEDVSGAGAACSTDSECEALTDNGGI
jgi:hypothetical protein